MTLFVSKKKGKDEIGEYFDCKDSTIYVISEGITEIEKKFGSEVILSVEKIGIGFDV